MNFCRTKKTNALIVLFFMFIGGLVFSRVACATTITGPLTSTELQSLNGTGATYGTPSNATFPDGPFTVGSGTPSALSGGPAATNANSVLLVLSASDPALLGPNKIALTFGTLGTVDFTSSDFYSTTKSGFPNKINGIANGTVNNIAFGSSDHAAVDILFGTSLSKGDFLGDVTIFSPIALRVDVFGDNNGLIVGNAANSGAEGISGGLVATPEPSTIALLGTGVVLIGFMGLRKRKALASKI